MDVRTEEDASVQNYVSAPLDGRGLNVDLVRDLGFLVFDSMPDSYLKPKHEWIGKKVWGACARPL